MKNKKRLFNNGVYTDCYEMVGITGNALPADVAKFVESGVNEVIIKPLSKNKLVDCLLRYLPST